MKFNPSRTCLPRHRPQVAADLSTATASVDGDATNLDVLALFGTRRELISLPVLDQGLPIGLISRNIFMSHMSRPYYQEVYGKKSCIAFMDKAPLIVDAAMGIEELTFRAVASGEKALADGFIITREGKLDGIGFGLHLMSTVASLHAEKHRQITHSIDYASVIQRAMLQPALAALADTLADAQLEWQPRDAVGGDFFHFSAYPDGWFAAIGDCTGHGVPGAFMTLLANSALSMALRSLGPRDPAALMGAVNRTIKGMLGQGVQQHAGTASNDGMDAVFLWFEQATRRLHIAGAQLSALLLAPGQADVRCIEGARIGVGYVDTPLADAWPGRCIEVAEGTMLCLATDGLVDQIGGPKAIAFGKRRLRHLLLDNRDSCALHLSQAILDDLHAWQGPQRRRDDLTLLCTRL